MNNKTSLIRNLWEEYIEYKTVIMLQHSVTEKIHFAVQSHESDNTINIDHSPT